MICTKCDQDKAPTEFHRQRDGHFPWCNEGHHFLPGDHVGITQFRKGYPIVGDAAGYVGLAMEECGPEEEIKVRIS